MKRRTEITIERHSVTIIRTTGEPFKTQCKKCGCFASAVDGVELANAMRLSVAAIHDLEAGGEVHAIHNGSNLLCGNSVAALLDRNTWRGALSAE